MKKLLKLKMNSFNIILFSVSTPFVMMVILLAGLQMICTLSLSDDGRATLNEFAAVDEPSFSAHSLSTNNFDDDGNNSNEFNDAQLPDLHYHRQLPSSEKHQSSDQLHTNIYDDNNHLSNFRGDDYLQGEHVPDYPPQSHSFPHRDHRTEDNDEDESENLDFLGRFLSMFSIYNTLFELPNFFNSRISLTKRLVSKPVKIPKKYFNETSNIIYDVRGPIEHGLSPPSSTSIGSPAAAIRPVAEILDTFKDKLKAIYPGTLWCGDGNTARSEHEVGIFRNTDTCCRMHDKCPSSIPAGYTFKNLRNGGLFTRSHCDCDQEFYRCLKKASSIVSNKIGYTYFNILRPQCFRREHPIIGCRKWTSKKCYIYVIDNGKLPIWQWFDNKMY